MVAKRKENPTETTTSTSNEKTEEVKKTEVKANAVKGKECQHFVYIGPSLPGGRLKSNTVLCGGIESIKEYYKEVIEKYPQVERLIVPVEKLGELKEKTQTHGNIINKYYGDVVSAMGENKEE
jgi:hypothetical protein